MAKEQNGDSPHMSIVADLKNTDTNRENVTAVIRGMTMGYVKQIEAADSPLAQNILGYRARPLAKTLAYLEGNGKDQWFTAAVTLNRLARETRAFIKERSSSKNHHDGTFKGGQIIDYIQASQFQNVSEEILYRNDPTGKFRYAVGLLSIGQTVLLGREKNLLLHY